MSSTKRNFIFREKKNKVHKKNGYSLRKRIKVGWDRSFQLEEANIYWLAIGCYSGVTGLSTGSLKCMDLVTVGKFCLNFSRALGGVADCVNVNPSTCAFKP